MPRARLDAALRQHRLGPHPLIRHFLDRLNFRGIIRDSLGVGLRQSLDHAEVLSVLVHNVLVSRGPMYRVGEWAQRLAPQALGLTAEQLARLNDDRLARSLDRLVSPSARSVFFRLALRAIKDFELSHTRVHFDTTTVTLFGQYDTARSEPKITHGYNKDHRPDLKQLVFGLDVTADGAVPLLHHVFSGNRTDDSVHIRNVDELRALLGREDFIYVADSKLCTSANLAHVAGLGGRFVTVLPRTHKEDQVFRAYLRAGQPPVRWRIFHTIANPRRQGDPPDVYATTTAGPQATAEGYRILWVKSSQKAQVDRHAREDHLRKAEIELKDLAGKVGKRDLRTHRSVAQRVKSVLTAQRVVGFLDVRIAAYTEMESRHLRRGRPRPGDPVQTIRRRKLRLCVRRNTAALKAEARTDGVFPLVTNLKSHAKREILEIYKYQPYLEKRFALTKSEYGVAPIFLKKPARVVGLLHVYFIAIMVSALIERQVRLAMQAEGIAKIPILPEGRPTTTPTTPRILENFADVAWTEFQEGERTVTFPVELNNAQKLLLKLAEVPQTLYQ